MRGCAMRGSSASSVEVFGLEMNTVCGGCILTRILCPYDDVHVGVYACIRGCVVCLPSQARTLLRLSRRNCARNKASAEENTTERAKTHRKKTTSKRKQRITAEITY